MAIYREDIVISGRSEGNPFLESQRPVSPPPTRPPEPIECGVRIVIFTKSVMSNKYRGLYNGVSHLFGKEVVVLRQDDNIIAYVMVDEIISVMQEGV